MNQHENAMTALANGVSISEKKAYNPPSLHDLDSVEKTEGGISPSILEATNGIATS